MKKPLIKEPIGLMIGEDSLLKLIPFLVDIGNGLLKGYGKPLNMKKKKDGSIVTSMDLWSHRRLTSLLQSFSKDPILSEEQVVPYEERKHWKQFWMIDPLDGTKAYISGKGLFCINIVLIREKRPVEALILSPLKKEVYYAKKGAGSFLITSKKEKIVLPQNTHKSLTLFCSESHEGCQMQEFCKRASFLRLRPLSSALKFSYVALSKPSLYLRLAGSSEWDIAAGDLIVSEAGGGMIDLTYQSNIIYNSYSLRSPKFLAYSKDVDYFKIMEIIKKT